MVLWAAFTGLAVLALGLVVLPLRSRAAQSAEHSTDNGPDSTQTADQLRRLAELEADVAAGDVAADAAAALRQELERQVLNAVDDAAPVSRKSSRGWLPLVAAIALLSVGTGAAMYGWLGAADIARFQLSHSDADLGDPEVAVEILLQRLTERLEQHPDDAEGWLLLGRTLLQIGRYDAAVTAAEHLKTLRPDDTAVKLLLVDALAMRAGGTLPAAAVALIDEVLEREPRQPTALVLRGMAFAEQGDGDAAIAAWQAALTELPPDSPLGAEITAMLDSMGATAPGAPTATVAAGASAPGETNQDTPLAVAITLSLAGNLDAAGLAPETPVFVLARTPQGPPAPLAVTRLSLGELPTTVTLSADMAMLPGHSMADYEQIELVARVSRSGQPQAQRGDLEGRAGPLAPRDNPAVVLTIDHTLP